MSIRIGKQLKANVSVPYIAQGIPGVNSTGGSDMASRIVAILQPSWEPSDDLSKGNWRRRIWQIQHGLPASSALIAFTKPFLDPATNSTTDAFSNIEYDNNGNITIYSNANWSGICVVASGIQELKDLEARQQIDQIMIDLASHAQTLVTLNDDLVAADTSIQGLAAGLAQLNTQLDSTNTTVGTLSTGLTDLNNQLGATNADLEQTNEFLFGLDGVSGWTAETDNRLTDLEGGMAGLGYVQTLTFDNNTGYLTWETRDGNTYQANLITNAMFADLSFDASTSELVITLQDGSEDRIDISSMVQTYTGGITATIQVSIDSSTNIITANIQSGSVTMAMLATAVQNMLNGAATQTALNAHTGDTTAHITGTERTNWNAVIANLATHIGDAVAHITATERAQWNAATPNVGTLTGIMAGDGLTGGGTTGSPTITLGQPADITNTSANNVTPTGHTHNLNITPAGIGSASQADFTLHINNGTVHITAQERQNWNAKQDALVSGTNIRTLNGQSLLGSGNIAISLESAPPFRQTVAWSGSPGAFSFTLPSTTHGKGANPLATVIIGGNVTDARINIAVNGDITIYSNGNLPNTILEVR